MDGLSIFQASNLLHNQERMSRYCPGGFYPVCLGDTFNQGRYQVHHKLGWGGFSTVWLAWDVKLEKWVSIKIMAADSSEQSLELRAIQCLQEKQASNSVVELFNSFIHQGPNGSHQCLVFELLGPTLDTIVADYDTLGDRLEPEIILKITKQLLQAVASLHKARYAHGDISGANIAFTSRNLTRLSKKKILQTIGFPEWETLVRIDGKAIGCGIPKQLVKTAAWDNWVEEDEEDIRLIDFGEAFADDNKPLLLAQPNGLEAPETIFADSLDYRVDLWRVGCTIYTLLFASRPFQSLGDIDYVVSQMINFVEKLPREWEPKWTLIKASAGRAWDSLPSEHDGQSKLECKFYNRVHEPSLQKLLPIIKGLMRFRPSERIEASDALELLDSIS